MPTVYLKMGLSNFINIYIWDKVTDFIKTFLLKGVLSCTLTISTLPTLILVSLTTSSLPVSNTHPTLCVSYTCI